MTWSTTLLAVLAFIAEFTGGYAQEQDGHYDPFPAEPYFIIADGSRYAARPGVWMDTVQANMNDDVWDYFARDLVTVYVGPGDSTSVARRYRTNDKILVGRSYPNGWARVWRLKTPPNARERRWEILGYVHRASAPLGRSPLPPADLPSAKGRFGEWRWYTKSDPIRDTPIAAAYTYDTQSTFPISFETSVSMMLVCDGEETKIAIRDPSTAYSIGDRYVQAEIRVDKRDAWSTNRAHFTTNLDGALLPSEWHDALLGEMRDGAVLHARVYDVMGTPHTASRNGFSHARHVFPRPARH